MTDSADDFLIVNDYPGDADGGSDFFTLADKGQILVNGEYRPERIVITPRELEFGGRICVGERTVRHLAHKFGMVDDWKVDALVVQLAEQREYARDLDSMLKESRAVVAALRATDPEDPVEVFVDLAGVRHLTHDSAVEAIYEQLGRQRPAPDVAPISATEAPLPAPGDTA